MRGFRGRGPEVQKIGFGRQGSGDRAQAVGVYRDEMGARAALKCSND